MQESQDLCLWLGILHWWSKKQGLQFADITILLWFVKVIEVKSLKNDQRVKIKSELFKF